ncbi:hypothetical protein DPMN_008198 [Dreissena polymorpha]|uniref:Uncharacterized protein n=1 Tax=Dreissena polymorpha TaxID=45954 RepID=A0A9D4MUW8_DREPO|nr:hypothetical protein DPMN_008198 [Dreissena polymorpha]
MLCEVSSSVIEDRGPPGDTYGSGWEYPPPSFSSVALYGKSNTLQLLQTSLVEKFNLHTISCDWKATEYLVLSTVMSYSKYIDP